MEMEASAQQSPSASASATPPSIWNIPNALSALRLICAAVMIPIAWRGEATLFGVLFAAGMVSDWIDGKLAVTLKQQTPLGARLDSIADNSLYAALGVGFWWLHGNVIEAVWPWIAAAVASYCVSVLASVAKFGKLPSYHTYAAKTTWHLLNFAVLAVFFGGWAWPLQLTMAAAVLVNLEELAITMALPESRVDVRSFWLVRRAE